MSLIEKRVTIKTHDGYQYIGVILDKYTGFTDVEEEGPNPYGGSVTLDTKISVDYYLLQTDEVIRHIDCSKIILLSIHEN